MASRIEDSPIAEIHIASIQGALSRRTQDVYFFLILSGEAEFHCGESISHATLHDVLMFPAGEPFSAHAAGSNLALIVAMRGDFFAQGQSAFLGTYICNSATDTERDYAMLRKLLSQLALTRIEHADIHGIHERELAYALVYYINRYHYVPHPFASEGRARQKYAARYAEIRSYLEQNYRQTVSLSDLAGRMYLSPAYLSRFIKQSLGASFMETLNQVRLRHAAEDLLRTAQPLTTVAYNNGFSSLSSFHRLFTAFYSLTPAEYRRQNEPAGSPSDGAVVEQHDYALVERTLSEFASRGEGAATAIRFPGQELCRAEDVGVSAPVLPLWNTLINIGYSAYLNNSNLQSQLAMAQREIGFRYGRIQSVLNDELLPPLSGGGYNYSDFDRFIEWMLSINLTPFLDLTYKPNYLLLDSQSVVYPSAERDAEGFNRSQRRFLDKVSALVRHCINTFGASEVERWGFEIGYMHDEYLSLTETPDAFVQRLSIACASIKKLLPGAMVGGVSHNVAVSSSVFERIVSRMEHMGFSPDFISLCCFPYERASGNAQLPLYVYSSDPDYALHKVTTVKDLLAGHPSVTQRLYLTVLGTDVKTRNPLSDSCFQSAFIVKNTIDLLGMVELIGYWQLSDIGTEYVDAARLLFGGTGILSKHGLKKPGFTALKRMNYLPAQLIKKGDGYLIATNTRNTYHAVVYNYAHCSDVFCVGDASTLPIEEVYSVFNNPSTKDVTIELCRMPAGRYKVITTSLNRENGSLLDEWLRYGILDDLQPRDIHYFRDIVHPQRLARYVDCADGVLALHAQLLPHEVKFYEIIREL